MTLYTQTSRKYDYLNFAPNLLPNLLMVYVLDSSNELNPFALIVYKFDGVKDYPVLSVPMAILKEVINLIEEPSRVLSVSSKQN